MPSDISELKLEDSIAKYLCEQHGYEEASSHDYNKEFAIDTGIVERFILSTQKEAVQSTQCFVSDRSKQDFFRRLARHLSDNGVTEVLRNGFRHNGRKFNLYYPMPSQLNPEAQAQYEKNIFAVTKELLYSQRNDNRIDLMVSLNGLPIMTMELKNKFTHQDVENAIKQYKTDRKPQGEPLLTKKRCAVHFAVDDDEIMMCTELAGKDSWFLPFNLGVNGGAGNPPREHGVRTAYLWEEILEKHSLSDILENYAQVVKKRVMVKDPNSGKKVEKEKEEVVWPRYHQLDAVRKMLKATKENDLGQKFLIQHSAGSGKSNSITWLAYQLVNLLNGNVAKFDSVIVVTDRINLDNQISKNITSFKRLENIVGRADSSQELKNLLEDGKKIIITLVHKFPFILDEIGDRLKDKSFAIIIDEAHSSQSGSMSASMNTILGGNAASGEEDLEDLLNKTIEGRRMLRNANYYAFTATPKNKTLQMFGIPFPGDQGETSYRPFHEYSMKQAIEEGFIMDVLKNYTTYKTFYQLVKQISEDPEFDNKKAQKKLRAWVESRPETIVQKASIIVNHFQTMVLNKGKVGGQARAMVVTNGIERAISYYYKITDLLSETGSPYKAIVAFSGTFRYQGNDVTESSINGFPSSEIEDRIEEDPYRILVVADKFQTGYDQPLLHTMYVDKTLTDVKAVQTLSRLNRCHPKKTDTFVLDFANEADDILSAFQRYYKTTILSKEADPNKLDDLINEIEEAHFYTEDEVENIVSKFYSNAEREELDPIINPIVDRFKQLAEDVQVNTKSCIKGYLRAYPFIASVIPFSSVEWEKIYTFYKLLIYKLPKLRGEDLTQGLIESIDLNQLRVAKRSEQEMKPDDEDTIIDPIPVGGGASMATPEMMKLSDILKLFNDVHWQNEELARRQIDELPARLQADERFVNAALNSDKATAQRQFNSSMEQIAVQMLTENTEFCRYYLDNESFRNFINENVFPHVYNSIISGGNNINQRSRA